MNKRILWLSLSMAALCITLVALPGSSQKVQSSDSAALSNLQARTNELQSSDDGDVEVFVENGGSWLGVETREVTAENVKSLKLPAERGALVGKIIPDSPAAKAGLKENDVITEVNGQRVEGTAQFHRMVREIPAGRTAQLIVLRDERPQNLNVTLGTTQANRMSRSFVRSGFPGSFVVQVPELPDVENLEEMNVFGNLTMGQPRMGIDAEDLHGALGTYFGAPDGEGVLVRNVFSGTPAEKAGLKAGDVITTVDGKRIRNISDLREQLKRSKSEEKTKKVGVLRNKAELMLDVYFPAAPKNEIHSRGERTNL
jgi:serine protease Do